MVNNDTMPAEKPRSSFRNVFWKNDAGDNNMLPKNATAIWMPKRRRCRRGTGVAATSARCHSKRFVSGRCLARSRATNNHTNPNTYTQRQPDCPTSARGKATTATPAPKPLAMANTLMA